LKDFEDGLFEIQDEGSQLCGLRVEAKVEILINSLNKDF